MKLISSREAVSFLAQAAPRPWVQRLLRWMAFDEGLTAYSSEGRVQPHTSVITVTGELIDEAGELSGANMDAAIRENFSPELAARLIGRGPYDRLDGEPFSWDDADDPVVLDVGIFLYAREIDWEKGVIIAEYIPHKGEMANVFFPDSELIASEFKDAEYEVYIGGLSFEFSAIELLLPNFQIGDSAGFSAETPDRKRRTGRPPKWDWEGAMAHVVAKAQTPDGLPVGAGAQARVEELIASWFTRETGDAPAASQVRQRAAKIMRTIDAPETP